MFEEEEELPVSPKPDIEPPPPPIGQDRGQTPPHHEPTAAALSQQEEADRSSNKVRRLTTESLSADKFHCSDP